MLNIDELINRWVENDVDMVTNKKYGHTQWRQAEIRRQFIKQNSILNEKEKKEMYRQYCEAFDAELKARGHSGKMPKWDE